jgi:hypothetical protein
MSVARDMHAPVEESWSGTVTAPTDEDAITDKSWDRTWLIRWREVGLLVAALVTVVGIGAVIGLTLTDWAAPNAITDLDDRVADAFVDSRTDTLTTIVPWAAGISDTFVKIGISALICCFFLWKWRRWDEAVYVALPLVLRRRRSCRSRTSCNDHDPTSSGCSSRRSTAASRPVTSRRRRSTRRWPWSCSTTRATAWRARWPSSSSR